ncbi:hypothetical protein EVAR_78421_1 [Eumeta japonica]|uniref:Uncharacterized protein n=1 Tax=Eumeta variegata TaxID=151549 RepID=A0A4C1TY05_EUMVA|nr:hypothetical protein EVAR_78421_1 [Eumeta japonica]
MSFRTYCSGYFEYIKRIQTRIWFTATALIAAEFDFVAASPAATTSGVNSGVVNALIGRFCRALRLEQKVGPRRGMRPRRRSGTAPRGPRARRTSGRKQIGRRRAPPPAVEHHRNSFRQGRTNDKLSSTGCVKISYSGGRRAAPPSALIYHALFQLAPTRVFTRVSFIFSRRLPEQRQECRNHSGRVKWAEESAIDRAAAAGAASGLDASYFRRCPV